MNDPARRILVVNGGSSSLKFAVYEAGATLARRLSGKIDRIGQSGTTFSAQETGGRPTSHPLDTASGHGAVAEALAGWLDEQGGLASLAAVGHRVTHGMAHTEPERLTPALHDELARIASIDPDHLPGEIEVIEAFQRRAPDLPQILCFDTAFHRTLPRQACLLPIPRRYDSAGIRRYGFHGLSYAYLLEELARRAGEAATQGRVVLAHLGSGASLAAVREGRSIDTSMGFTPTGGLPMGTRCGDLDPGVAAWLAQSEAMTPAAFFAMANHDSGLLGISGTSADMRELLALEAIDQRAAEAVSLFCYQAKKTVGAYAAALGGLDHLVFSGGIGENAAAVRRRICEGLGFLGIALDESANEVHRDIISAPASRVTVHVIRTDEELMIARSVARTLHLLA
jgi:acetate kinase